MIQLKILFAEHNARDGTLRQKFRQFPNMLRYTERTCSMWGFRNLFQKFKILGDFWKNKNLFSTTNPEKFIKVVLMTWNFGSKPKVGFYGNLILLLLSFWPTVDELATPSRMRKSSFRYISTYWDINLVSKCLPAHCERNVRNIGRRKIFGQRRAVLVSTWILSIKSKHTRRLGNNLAKSD